MVVPEFLVAEDDSEFWDPVTAVLELFVFLGAEVFDVAISGPEVIGVDVFGVDVFVVEVFSVEDFGVEVFGVSPNSSTL